MKTVTIKQRSSRSRRLQIIALVTDMLVRNFSEHQICNMIMKKFRITRKSVKAVIEHIYKRWAEQTELTMKQKRARAVLARRQIVSQAWMADNLDMVLKAEDSMSKIEGTYYNEGADNDTDLQFVISLRKSKEDDKILKEYADDLENPEAFDKRVEKQMEQFMTMYDEVEDPKKKGR